MTRTDDPYDLERFVRAQEPVYAEALAEIQGGAKVTHWIWFVFPQLDGLAPNPSANTRFYSIKSLDEARAYLAHPVLGARLIACVEATLAVEGRSAERIFGWIDARKVQSCATLFALAAPPGSVFTRLLERYYDGQRDENTVSLLHG